MKRRVKRLLIGGGVFAVACVLHGLVPDVPEIVQLAVFLAAYLIVGLKVLKKAIRNILAGSVFDENFLMAIASVGAFCIGEYPEAVAVMLFYQVGELFEDFAVGKSRKSITDLMNIRPDSANLLDGDEVKTVDPEEVQVGQTILVRPGEKIPLDGEVVFGESMVDTAALTGESVPQAVREGSQVLSGCINQSGLLKIRVTKHFGESTVSKILDLVENATMKKARTENFITRFAAVYTPIVVIAALVLAILPPLVVPGAVFSDWLYRALNFLVVSCPCALVISVPLSFFGGIGGASKKGILVKGSSYLELMADAEIAVMDKTGTLTKGVFEVEKVEVASAVATACASTASLAAEDWLLDLAAVAEVHSSHPIAVSLKKAAEKKGMDINASRISDVEERSGRGVVALVDGKWSVAAGNSKLMKEVLGEGDFAGAELAGVVDSARVDDAGTMVYVAVDGIYAGKIRIADQIKPDAADAIASLKAKGVKTVMLTGDSKAAGEAVAGQLGIDEVHTQLLPGDKVDRVEDLLGKLETQGKRAKRRGRLIFVGDGINDAPVLARADVGVAMGGLGSDAAIEAADIVIMNDEPSKLAYIIEIAKKTMRIVHQNIVFALGVKLLVLGLSAFGYANMWLAVFADVGVSMLAILNSFRAMRVNSNVRFDGKNNAKSENV